MSPGLQPPLATSFSTGERLHFGSSTLATSSQLASSSSFGNPSTLTPLAAAATASRLHLQLLSTTVTSFGSAVARTTQSVPSSRSDVGYSTVKAAVSVQPPARSSLSPLSRGEHEALMMQSPQSPSQMSPVEPASASTEASAPAPAAVTMPSQSVLSRIRRLPGRARALRSCRRPLQRV